MTTACPEAGKYKRAKKKKKVTPRVARDTPIKLGVIVSTDYLVLFYASTETITD